MMGPNDEEPLAIEWFCAGTPVAKPRMTAASSRNKYNKRYWGWHELNQWAAKLAFWHPVYERPWTGPIFLKLLFLIDMPQSWSEKQKADAGYHLTKPDLKNLVAGVEDALNGLAYIDDAQIVSHDTSKHWCLRKQGYIPGVAVRVCKKPALLDAAFEFEWGTPEAVQPDSALSH